MPYFGIRPYNFSTKLEDFTQVITELPRSLLHYAAIIWRELQRNSGTLLLAFMFDAELLIPSHETGYVQTINYQWSFYIRPGLTFRTSPFCPQTAFVCFCGDLRINNDYFPTEHYLIDFIIYNNNNNHPSPVRP